MRTIRTKIVGVTARNDDGTRRQDLIEFLSPGEELELVRDPDNEHDENAVEVHDSGGDQLGFVRRELAEEVAHWLDEGIPVEAIVLEVTGGDDGRNHGVNIELRVYDGDGAEDRERRYAVMEKRQREDRATRMAPYAPRQAQHVNQRDRGGTVVVALLVVVVLALLFYVL